MKKLTKLPSFSTLIIVGCIIVLPITACAAESGVSQNNPHDPNKGQPSPTLHATASGGSQNTLQEKQKSFAGKWKKISSIPCATRYPDNIEFFNATYLGKKGQSGQGFIIWDAGGYQVLQEDQVKIDIATDQQVLYKFSISQDILTFVDPTGCQFQYRKVD